MLLLVLIVIAGLLAVIVFGKLLSSRLFWIIVFGLMVASYIGGHARAAGDDADAILQSMPANMKDYAACVIVNAASLPYALPAHNYFVSWSDSCENDPNFQLPLTGQCAELQERLLREVAESSLKSLHSDITR